MDNDPLLNSHLIPFSTDDSLIDQDIDKRSDSDISSIDSDIEIDDTEQVNTDFIQLNLNNDDSDSDDELENSKTSSNNEEIICLDQTPPSTTAKASTTTTTSTHHERRQWSFEEKLKIISELNKGVSLHVLESKYKCTRKMIRRWKNNENQLIKLVKEKGGKGKKRKRINGAGAKLTYSGLDEHLIKWYRSKRGMVKEM